MDKADEPKTFKTLLKSIYKTLEDLEPQKEKSSLMMDAYNE